MGFDPLTDEFSIRAGAVRLHDLGYLIAGNDKLDEDDVAHTAVFEWDETTKGWGGYDLSWIATSACVCDYPKEQMVAIGRFGQFLVFGQHEEYEGVIKAKPTPSGTPAPFRGARSIAGKAYAVGMNSHVFRRDARTTWVADDQGIKPKTDLEAIDGFAEDDLYAVGWKGAMWKKKGKRWSKIESPSNLILTDVCCAGNGLVYVCGQAGTLLRGRDDEWEVIAHESTEADLWDVEWFNDELYVSTTQFLYKLNDKDELKLVKFGSDRPKSCYKLSTRDGVMWSIGPKDVMSFNGKKWTRIT